LLPAAQRVAARYGLPVSVMLAQAALESNWGRSRLARVARNLFGIKGVSRHAEAVTLPTCEYNGDGRARVVAARFAAYASVEECLGDYARLLAFAPRYAAARAVADDPFAFAQQLAACGYATDPAYGKKICALMRRYELTRFDSERVPRT
jgi:flagellum-specific peptidoglycan hydrolase FlgJ